MPFAKPQAAAWVRDKLVPQSSRLASLGPNGLVRQLGVYAVDVFVPSNIGTADLDTLADAVVTTFPPSLQLVQAGQTITIQRSERLATRPEPDWLMAQITILWQADTVNSI